MSSKEIEKQVHGMLSRSLTAKGVKLGWQREKEMSEHEKDTSSKECLRMELSQCV